MLRVEVTAGQKRIALRNAWRAGRLLRFPGAFSPLVALLIEQLGFEGVYGSGAVLSAMSGLPDIGLTSQQEVVQFGAALSRATNLPTLVDFDTGFGEPVNVARSVQLAEEAGITAIHLEDQTLPKRCGHLDHKELVSTDAMVRKIRAAVEARRDPELVVIARTDARGVEGIDAAIARAQAYVAAGADAIFPEALETRDEFAQFRQAIDVPLVANLTEFGKSPYLTIAELEQLHYNLVIYPVTTLRLAMQAVEEGLRHLAREGTQAPLLDQMQTRSRLYDILHYADYAQWDARIGHFKS